MDPEERITYFAETDARNKRVAFGIKAKDRTKHMYVLGKTGMGKSTLLENMAVQDIQNGEGMCFIDPHGKSADLLLEYIPKERINDVVYFAPFDTDFPISFNIMEDVGVDKRHLVVSGLISAFKKIWVDTWSARMEYILTNTILALLEYPDSTLLGINKMYSDKEYRKKVVDNVTDPSVRSFWVDEYAKYTERFAAEATPAIQNKIGQFTSNPIIRNVIGQPKSSFDIRNLMDNRKILIVNLSKGRVGEVNANLMGSMLITKIYLGAMSRADTAESQLRKLPNFYMYVDEFQSFANESFADILSEARKYKLNLTIAHQYIEQMSEEVRAAVLGNVGTMIIFRVGAYDADVLEKEFAPTFMKADLVNLGQRQIYLKLMINDVTSTPFSAGTLPPIKKPEISNVELVLDTSRKLYTQPRAIVEEQIRMAHGMQTPAKLAPPERTDAPAGDRRIEPRADTRDAAPRRAEQRPEAPRHDPREQAPRAAPRAYNDRPASSGPAPHAQPQPQQVQQQEQPQRPPLDEKPKVNPFQSIKLEQEGNGPMTLVKEEGERDVLSLSQLASKEPQKKTNNNAKAATPENVNALRDVLSSILKKNPPASSQASVPAGEKKAEKSEPSKAESAPKDKEAPSHQKEGPAGGRERPHSSPGAGETRREEGQGASYAPPTQREVPEAVLKKVLSMDPVRDK